MLEIKRKVYEELNKVPFFGKRVLSYYDFFKFRHKVEKVIAPNVGRQLIFKKGRGNTASAGSPTILIPWMETQHYSLYTMLILAKALQLRGARVKILVCDQYLDACEGKNFRNVGVDMCRRCKITQTGLIPLFGFEMMKLSELIDEALLKRIKETARDICMDYPSRFERYGVNLIFAVEESIIRYYFGAEPPSQEERFRIRVKHLITAMICLEASRVIEEKVKPDIILGQLWVYSMGRPFYEFFENVKKRKTYWIGIVNQNYSAYIINEIETYFHNKRFFKFLELRGHKELTDEERLELKGWFDERLKGKSVFHVEFGGFQKFNRNMDLENMLKIDRSKRNLFMFPNLFWDAGMNETNSIYKSLIDWAVSTVDILKDHPEINLYIKPHIVEAFGTPSAKGVLDFIYDKYPVLPKNIIPVFPEWRISPYDLFPYMDAALVYNSTVGVEATYFDIPVIAGGLAQYSGLNFVWEPKTVEEYTKLLLDKNLKTRHDKKRFELFCYYYIIKRPVPFNLTDRVSSNVYFEKYKFESLDDILPGKNYMLDHLCNCILKDKLPEAW